MLYVQETNNRLTIYISYLNNTISCMQSAGLEQKLEQPVQIPTPISAVTEQRLVGLMNAEYSWEQIIYDIIASENLDPWNLDLAILASSFLDSIKKTKELDFRVPAKYVIIASTLLKMKSDYLKLVSIPGEGPEETFFDSIEEPTPANGFHKLEIGNFELADKRRPVRRVVITDLINALKRVMRAEERKVVRTATMKEKIKIGTENITQCINVLYKRIQDVLGSMQEEEVRFSKLVPQWNRKHIVDTFLPLVYLHHDKKVYCRQDDFFQEIFVKKMSGLQIPQEPAKETNIVKKTKVNKSAKAKTKKK